MIAKEIKNEILLEFFAKKKISDLSKKYQVSKSTIYIWLKGVGYSKATQNKFDRIFKLVEENKFDLALEEIGLISKKNKRIDNNMDKSFLKSISQEIKMLIKKNRLNEALERCKEEYCKYNLYIQSQKIAILMRQGKLTKALDECNKEYCKHNLYIQSQKIAILMRQEELTKALDECNKEYCEQNLSIQSQKIAILMQQGELTKALNECKKEYCKYDLPIHSQKIAILMKQGELEEALEECNKKYCKYNLPIQSQKIAILMQQGELEAALDECKEEYCKQNLPIQSQKIAILMKQRRLNKALAECNKEYCKNNLLIQSQKIAILMKQGEQDEALKEYCLQNLTIQSQKNYILGNSEKSKNSEINTETLELLYSLSCGCLTLQKIQKSLVSSFEKTVFTCAYYEQMRVSNGLHYIKQQLNGQTFSEKEYIKLKKLLEHLKRNHKIFDVAFYNELLTGQAFMDFSDFISYSQKEEKTISKAMQVKETPSKTEKKCENFVTSKKQAKLKESFLSQKNKTDNLISNKQSVKEIVVPIKTKKIVKEKITKPTQTLREKYYKEILQLEKRIYIAMQTQVLQEQKRAIKAWDILESISLQPSNNQEALEKLSRILKKCNEE